MVPAFTDIMVKRTFLKKKKLSRIQAPISQSSIPWISYTLEILFVFKVLLDMNSRSVQLPSEILMVRCIFTQKYALFQYHLMDNSKESMFRSELFAVAPDSPRSITLCCIHS